MNTREASSGLALPTPRRPSADKEPRKRRKDEDDDGPLRIGIVSPLIESVPPKVYGGTERVVSYLTEELVRQGHEVTLYASGDSITQARLRPVVPRGLRLDPDCLDPTPAYARLVDEVFRETEAFDLLHFNIEFWHFPLARRLKVNTVTTLHGRLDIPDLVPFYRHFDTLPLISISESQRQPLAWANWAGTVPHGLPANLYRFHPRHSGYLAFLGRMSPEKGPDCAIRIARAAGIPLRMAAKVDKADRHYFEGRIRPLLQGPGVEYIGEIGEAEKDEFLGGALALLFPIDWPEPFGLVMIESMACGTPVVAYRRGSVPEVVRDGISGYLVEDEKAAVAAVLKCADLSRKRCRADFETRFCVERMASDYIRIYRRLIATSRTT